MSVLSREGGRISDVKGRWTCQCCAEKMDVSVLSMEITSVMQSWDADTEDNTVAYYNAPLRALVQAIINTCVNNVKVVRPQFCIHIQSKIRFGGGGSKWLIFSDESTFCSGVMMTRHALATEKLHYVTEHPLHQIWTSFVSFRGRKFMGPSSITGMFYCKEHCSWLKTCDSGKSSEWNEIVLTPPEY